MTNQSQDEACVICVHRGLGDLTNALTSAPKIFLLIRDFPLFGAKNMFSSVLVCRFTDFLLDLCILLSVSPFYLLNWVGMHLLNFNSLS